MPAYPADPDTVHVRTAVFDGNVGAESLERTPVFITGEPSPTAWQWWRYTENLLLNIYQYVDGLSLDELLPPVEQPFLLVEDLESNGSEYHVLPQQEEVDGSWCHVIERPRVCRIWVDSRHGFAIRRAQLHWPKEYSAPLVRKVITNRDFREAKPGLWIPWEQVEERYADPKYEKRHFFGKPVNRRVLKVSFLEFDSLADDFFRLEVEPGAMVYDQIRGIEYVNHSPDAVPFQDAIQFANVRINEQGHWRRLLLLVNAVLFGTILLTYLVFTLRRSHSR